MEKQIINEMKPTEFQKLQAAEHFLTDPNDRNRFFCIPIIGQIEGHYLLPEGQKATKYEQLIPLLVDLEQSRETDGILLILNTMGGDVEAGLALAELIASMNTPTVSLVLGGGHSIGIPLATSARYSLIAPSATMMLHPVRINGTVLGVPQSFRYMGEMQKRIVHFICSHSRAKKEEVEMLMLRPDELATDCGSILEGKEAVRYGILNAVGGLSDALKKLHDLSERSAHKSSISFKNKNKNNSCSKKRTDCM